MKRIKIINGADFKRADFRRKMVVDRQLQETVTGIISNVQENGDQALKEYSAKFDKCELENLRVPEEEIKKAGNSLDAKTREIIEKAAENIRSFHAKEAAKSWKDEEADGTVLGQLVSAIDRVGIYIPGGRAVYPSTLLMNAIPAQIAGVPEIVVVSPPGSNGLPNQQVLACCSVLGLTEVYAVGGVQSIAALAYGTESIAPVYKITGPGNAFVTEAKRQVFGQVGIDSVAGPSEILILHDDPAIPTEYIVRDLLSQAEHDPMAQSILITTSDEMANAVADRLQELVPTLPRQEEIIPSIENKGMIIKVDQIEQGFEICNFIAPEHLELLLADENKIDLLRNAGAVFVGAWSSEPVGDYFAGPNHTIPTSGAARYSSPLSTKDFQKESSYIKYSKQRLEKEGELIASFADMEGLHAHAAAVRVRLEK